VQTFSSSTPIAAHREIVWEVMTDHRLYSRWSAGSRVDLEVEGSPDRNGVGAIRVFHAGIVRAREEITAFDPPNRMTYRALSMPLPVRNYRAEMVLASDETGNGCTLHWESWFEATIPLTAGMSRRIMSSSVSKMAAGIAEEAQSRTRSA